MQNSKFKIQNILYAFCIFNFAFIIAASSGCSIPNLETPNCSAARDAAKRFYSFHFANDMQYSRESLELRKSYLAPDFYEKLKSWPSGIRDPFTRADEFPRTFRIGRCSELSDTKVDMQIQLYWKDDSATVQRELAAFLDKSGDAWLVSGVEPPGH